MKPHTVPNTCDSQKNAINIQEIKFNKWYLCFKGIVHGFFAFVMFGFFWLSISDGIHRPTFILTLSIPTGLAGFIVAGSSLEGWHKLLRQYPALILDKRGITDKTNRTSARRIDWQEICGFDVYEMRKGKGGTIRMLRIHLCDPRDNFGRPARLIYDGLMHSPYKTIDIRMDYLDMREDPLLELLSNMHAHYSVTNFYSDEETSSVPPFDL